MVAFCHKRMPEPCQRFLSFGFKQHIDGPDILVNIRKSSCDHAKSSSIIINKKSTYREFKLACSLSKGY